MEPPLNPYESPRPLVPTAPPATDAPTETPPRRPWGAWATLGWCLLAAVAWLAVSTIAGIVFVVVYLVDNPGAANELQAFAEQLEHHGLLLSVTTWTGNTAALAILILAVRLRKWRLGEYFAVGKLRGRDLVYGLLCLAVFIPLADGMTVLCGKPVVPEFMIDAYHTAGFVPLLVLTIVVAAPIGEELFFRGFLYRGLAESRLGPEATIVLSSLVWSTIHIQYDLFQVSQVFAGGLLLGVLRWKTGSTTLAILLHALMNLVATIEAVVVIELL